MKKQSKLSSKVSLALIAVGFGMVAGLGAHIAPAYAADASGLAQGARSAPAKRSLWSRFFGSAPPAPVQDPTLGNEGGEDPETGKKKGTVTAVQDQEKFDVFELSINLRERVLADQKATILDVPLYVSRDQKLDQVISTLRIRGNIVALVGETGAGRSTMAYQFQQRILAKQVPPDLLNKTIRVVDGNYIVGGTKHRGDTGKRVAEIFQDLAKEKASVLFIENAGALFGGGSGESSAGKTINNMVASSGVQVIMELDWADWRAAEKEAPRAVLIEMDALSGVETLQSAQIRIEAERKIRFDRNAIVRIAELCEAYRPYPLDNPGRGIKFMEELASKVDTRLTSSSDETRELERQIQKLQRDLSTSKHDPSVSVQQRLSLNEQIQALELHLARARARDQISQSMRLIERQIIELEFKLEPLEAEFQKRVKAREKVAEIEASPLGKEMERIQKEISGFRADLREISSTYRDAGGDPTTRRVRITEQFVLEEFSKLPKMPNVEFLTGDEASRLQNMEENLKKRIFNQDQAIESMVEILIRSRTGSNDPKLPLGVIPFQGTTGVGKTELAKATAALFFGSEERLIIVDGNEYTEKTSVYKLYGADPGHVGYTDGGTFLDQVERMGQGVILIDEVGRMNKAVKDALMQALDEGRMRRSDGKIIDAFRNFIIILSTNAGEEFLGPAQELLRQMKEHEETLRDWRSKLEVLMEELKKLEATNPQPEKEIAAVKERIKTYSEGIQAAEAAHAELLREYNELKDLADKALRRDLGEALYGRATEDGAVQFNPPSIDSFEKMVAARLAQLNALYVRPGYRVVLSPSAINQIAQECMQPGNIEKGGRSVRQVFKKYISNRMAREILAKNVASGDVVSYTANGEAPRTDVQAQSGGKVVHREMAKVTLTLAAKSAQRPAPYSVLKPKAPADGAPAPGPEPKPIGEKPAAAVTEVTAEPKPQPAPETRQDITLRLAVAADPSKTVPFKDAERVLRARMKSHRPGTKLIIRVVPSIDGAEATSTLKTDNTIVVEFTERGKNGVSAVAAEGLYEEKHHLETMKDPDQFRARSPEQHEADVLAARMSDDLKEMDRVEKLGGLTQLSRADFHNYLDRFVIPSTVSLTDAKLFHSRADYYLEEHFRQKELARQGYGGEAIRFFIALALKDLIMGKGDISRMEHFGQMVTYADYAAFVAINTGQHKLIDRALKIQPGVGGLPNDPAALAKKLQTNPFRGDLRKLATPEHILKNGVSVFITMEVLALARTILSKPEDAAAILARQEALSAKGIALTTGHVAAGATTYYLLQPWVRHAVMETAVWLSRLRAVSAATGAARLTAGTVTGPGELAVAGEFIIEQTILFMAIEIVHRLPEIMNWTVSKIPPLAKRALKKQVMKPYHWLDKRGLVTDRDVADGVFAIHKGFSGIRHYLTAPYLDKLHSHQSKRQAIIHNAENSVPQHFEINRAVRYSLKDGTFFDGGEMRAQSIRFRAVEELQKIETKFLSDTAPMRARILGADPMKVYDWEADVRAVMETGKSPRFRNFEEALDFLTSVPATVHESYRREAAFLRLFVSNEKNLRDWLAKNAMAIEMLTAQEEQQLRWDWGVSTLNPILQPLELRSLRTAGTPSRGQLLSNPTQKKFELQSLKTGTSAP